MYIVVLLVNGEYYYTPFTDICLAIDYAIAHYKVFNSIINEKLNIIYNRLDYDGIGGFNFRLEVERLGNKLITWLPA